MTTGERMLSKEATEIKKTMLDKGILTKDLAKILGVSEPYISQAITGSGSKAIQKIRQRILDVLDLELP